MIRRVGRRALAIGLAVTAAMGCNSILGNDDGFLKPDASVQTGAAGSGPSDGSGAGGSRDSGGADGSGGSRDSGSGGSRATGGGGTVDGSGGSSTGGSSDVPEGGPDAPAPVCMPNQTRCSTTPNAIETCSGDGQWGPAMACPYVCANDKCGGTCTPNDKQCDVKIPQTCGADGEWASRPACGNLCALGECVDLCTVGTRQCTNLTPQRCEGGVWVDEMPCRYLCKMGGCTGVCSPNDGRCMNGTQETCDATGNWANGIACTFPCAGNVCGVCAVNDTRCSNNLQETCTSGNVWGPGATCTNGCIGKTCAACVPTTKRCTNLVPETCLSNGQWSSGNACPFVCKDGNCIGSCVPTTTRCTNGTQETCASDGTWGMSVACGFGCAGVVCASDLCPTGDCSTLLRTTSGKPMDGWAQVDTPIQVSGADAIQGFGSTDGVPTGANCVGSETRPDHGLLFKDAHWQLAGTGITAGTTYQVTFHVWGVVECKTYVHDPTKCPQAPNVGRDASYNLWCPEGSDPAPTPDHYNTYMISVTPTSSATTMNVGPQNLGPLPAAGNWWTLNECPAGIVESHQTWKIDHDVTIAVPGGSWVNFVTFDTNCRSIINCGNATDSGTTCVQHYTIDVGNTVPPPPSSVSTQPAAGTTGGYGQWLYFDVKSVHQ